MPRMTGRTLVCSDQAVSKGSSERCVGFAPLHLHPDGATGMIRLSRAIYVKLLSVGVKLRHFIC